MGFSTAFLDGVRDRVSIAEVVGRSVLWDKRKSKPAKGDYWACCPFHGEKTPSFHVDDRKGIYHCFGCGVSGDAFSWLVNYQHKAFPEAVQELAELAGMEVERPTPETRAAAARRLTLIEANEAAARWYQQRLRQAPTVLAYARERGLTDDDIERFRIGYAPDGNALLAARLMPAESAIGAGLAGKSEDNGHVYDRFRGRLMFPILDAKGQAVAFSGRSLKAGQDPKYLNSPETEVFNKGSMFFNGAAAKAEAWDGKTLVLVEGHIDVIASERAGYATVGSMGTALTAEHVGAMVKMSDEPVICFDGDSAGRRAAHKAIDLLLPVVSPRFSARFAALPDGQDPDSLIKRSPRAYDATVAGAVPLADALWQRETVGVSSTPEAMAKLEAALFKAVDAIQHEPTRRAYRGDMRDRLKALARRPQMYRSNGFSHHSTSPSSLRLTSSVQRVGLSLKEAMLVSAIVCAPEAALDAAERLAMDDRLSAAGAELIGKLLAVLAATDDVEGIGAALAAAGLSDAVREADEQAAGCGVILVGETAAAILAGARRH